MIRYIDAGTARQHLTDRLMESALNNVGIKADADEVFRDIAENRLPVWIDELQTYDVTEVRHGEWVFKFYCGNMSGYDYGMDCSVCGKPMYRQFAEKMPPYCPNCGASMRGEEE